MPINRLYVEWLDVNTAYLRTANWVATPAGVTAYLAALQAASNAGQIITTAGTALTPNNPATDAIFPSALDTAVLQFRTAAMSTVVVTVPAPLSALFKADHETVDPADPTGLLAAAVACLGDTLGNAVTAFAQGVRAQRRKDIA